MSETKEAYFVSGQQTDPNANTLLLYTDMHFERPSVADLRLVIRRLGLSGSEVAGRVGVSPDTVRKWQAARDSPSHKQIPYAAWRLLLIEAGLVMPPRSE